MDEDVLVWFKGQGKGYQTRINQLLRSYMQSQQR
ncbi:BrnA antitoxin family protein [Oceanicoccus sagamiensis]|nr:BrnA antitoxin family protein [Oceanicoccus sagamiensis]